MSCKVAGMGNRNLSTLFRQINKITKYIIIFGRKNEKRKVVEQVVIVKGEKMFVIHYGWLISNI